MSFLITIEGIDGSGKGTQAKMLLEHLTQAGISASLLSFPRYQDTFFGHRAADFLNGRFGTLNQVHPFLASLLFAGDRWESRDYLIQALREVDVVICDRYIPSNLAHQCSKLAADAQPELMKWLQHLEYKLYQMPEPDLVVWLNLPVQLAQQLVLRKNARDYTQRSQDIQEADSSYLEKVALVYTQLAAEQNWYTLNMLADALSETIRTVDSIAAEILKIVQQALLAKSSQHDHPLAQVQSQLNTTLALTATQSTSASTASSATTFSWEELIHSRKEWLESVLKPWCRSANEKQLFQAELEWQNLAGNVDPQFTLWRWAWSRFEGLVHPQLGIDETHEIQIELLTGEVKRGYPDARQSLRQELVLFESGKSQITVKLAEIRHIQRMN